MYMTDKKIKNYTIMIALFILINMFMMFGKLYNEQFESSVFQLLGIYVLRSCYSFTIKDYERTLAEEVFDKLTQEDESRPWHDWP